MRTTSSYEVPDVSLTKFHIAFITASVVLALLFGWWCVDAFLGQGGAAYLVFGILSFGAALGLIVYGEWFLRKMRSTTRVDSWSDSDER